MHTNRDLFPLWSHENRNNNQSNEDHAGAVAQLGSGSFGRTDAFDSRLTP